jgi:hypothetical protein
MFGSDGQIKSSKPRGKTEREGGDEVNLAILPEITGSWLIIKKVSTSTAAY